MNLRGIVAVSGRPGLFKLVGQNKAGYVLESLDAQKIKIIANVSNTKLASLEDITVYGEEEELKLKAVFTNLAAFKGTIPDAKADANALKTIFLEVAKGYDQDKVYASDMKKILTWFHLLKEMPLFTEAEPKEGEEEGLKIEEKADLKSKTTKAKAANVKAPSKTNAPAKKASMTSKKGV